MKVIGGSWGVKHAELQSQQALQEVDMKVLIKQSREESLYFTTQMIKVPKSVSQ